MAGSACAAGRATPLWPEQDAETGCRATALGAALARMPLWSRVGFIACRLCAVRGRSVRPVLTDRPPAAFVPHQHPRVAWGKQAVLSRTPSRKGPVKVSTAIALSFPSCRRRRCRCSGAELAMGCPARLAWAGNMWSLGGKHPRRGSSTRSQRFLLRATVRKAS